MGLLPPSAHSFIHVLQLHRMKVNSFFWNTPEVQPKRQGGVCLTFRTTMFNDTFFCNEYLQSSACIKKSKNNSLAKEKLELCIIGKLI